MPRLTLIALLLLSLTSGLTAQAGPQLTQVKPSVADPTLTASTQKYDAPSFVYVPAGKPRPELVVFLPASGGVPEKVSTFLSTIASDGFRVIGLTYNDNEEVDQVCEPTNSVACAGDLRRERMYGDVANAAKPIPANEAAVHRLEKLLAYLVKTQPNQGWETYLTPSGAPNWPHIIVTGHSQGSGMAAFLCKIEECARVVLFSGPVDGINLRSDNRKFATWISGPSKTPPDRWYASYHGKERAGPLYPITYGMLGIPPTHITVFTLDMPAGSDKTNYHPMGVADIRYAPQWKQMFGVAGK
jgi:hypothetical protein